MTWHGAIRTAYCCFVGRNDDVIKCSGYRIGPFEVESALRGASGRAWSAPSPPRPTRIRGQVVKATIVLAKGWEPRDELTKELQDHVKQHDRALQVSRVSSNSSSELPKTIGGKIKRKLIRTNDGIED